jgi:hypothetical protein
MLSWLQTRLALIIRRFVVRAGALSHRPVGIRGRMAPKLRYCPR